MSKTSIEPCFIEPLPSKTSDLLIELTELSQPDKKLNVNTASSLASLVRVMNCYYSNLIEGHNTKLQDIHDAMQGELQTVAADDKTRNLQLEAVAHIRVQEEIDKLHLNGQLPEPTSPAFICWLHQSFYHNATDEMLMIDKDKQVIMTPGQFRIAGEEVAVGRHIPCAGKDVNGFMQYFGERYSNTGRTNRMISAATAHHRLVYIHPFLDGNGRVARLMSHAINLKAGVGASGLWSISRGLARGIRSNSEYKLKLDSADTVRQGDLDGRGNLSQASLIDYTNWFLEVSCDQARFMSGLFDLKNLSARLDKYVEIKELSPESKYILSAVLTNGEIARGDASRLTGLKERRARDVLSALVNDGIIGSDKPKGAVSLRFTIDSSRILFPRLFEDFSDQ